MLFISHVCLMLCSVLYIHCHLIPAAWRVVIIFPFSKWGKRDSEKFAAHSGPLRWPSIARIHQSHTFSALPCDLPGVTSWSRFFDLPPPILFSNINLQMFQSFLVSGRSWNTERNSWRKEQFAKHPVQLTLRASERRRPPPGSPGHPLHCKGQGALDVILPDFPATHTPD